MAALTLFPLQYKRQDSVPVDVDLTFATTAERVTYLSNARRYAGMLVVDTEEERAYLLNTARDAWIPVGSGGSGGGFVFQVDVPGTSGDVITLPALITATLGIDAAKQLVAGTNLSSPPGDLAVQPFVTLATEGGLTTYAINVYFDYELHTFVGVPNQFFRTNGAGQLSQNRTTFTVDFTNSTFESAYLRSDAPRTGKAYFEFSITGADTRGYLLGFMEQTAWALDDYPDNPYLQPSYVVCNGDYNTMVVGLLTNGVASSDSAYDFTTGDTIGFAVNYDNGNVWISKNGVWIQGSPTGNISPTWTLPSGAFDPYVSVYGKLAPTASHFRIVGRFTTNQFLYTPPSGFVNPNMNPLGVHLVGDGPVRYNPTYDAIEYYSVEQAGYIDIAMPKVRTKTSDYTLTATDNQYVFRMNSSGPINLIVPNDSTLNLPIGFTAVLSKNGSGATSFFASPGVTILSPSTLTIAMLYGKASITKTGANQWEVEGNIGGSVTLDSSGAPIGGFRAYTNTVVTMAPGSNVFNLNAAFTSGNGYWYGQMSPDQPAQDWSHVKVVGGELTLNSTGTFWVVASCEIEVAHADVPTSSVPSVMSLELIDGLGNLLSAGTIDMLKKGAGDTFFLVPKAGVTLAAWVHNDGVSGPLGGNQTVRLRLQNPYSGSVNVSSLDVCFSYADTRQPRQFSV